MFKSRFIYLLKVVEILSLLIFFKTDFFFKFKKIKFQDFIRVFDPDIKKKGLKLEVTKFRMYLYFLQKRGNNK